MTDAVAAVDVGGTELRVGIAAEARRVAAGVTEATPELVDEIPAAITAAIHALGEPIDGVGVGVAGLVDAARGVLTWMPHREGQDVQIARLLSETTGAATVVVDNDANLAALAEARLGAGRDHRMVMMITVGTGIGAGLVIEGHIEHGRAYLGEVGHTTLDPAGPQCRCGLRGCWESLASGTALDRAARRIADSDPRGPLAAAAAVRGSRAGGPDLTAAAAAGDSAANAELDRVADNFGAGLANVVAFLDPDVIVVGGGVVAELGERFLVPARRAMIRELAGADHRPPTPVVAGEFGARAGLVGAVVAVQDVRKTG